MADYELSNVSIDELQMEIQRRQRGYQKLLRRRDRLMAELNEVENEIRRQSNALNIAAAPNGSMARRNSQSLPDALMEALGDSTMSIPDLTEAVQRNGYRSTSPNFRSIVNQTLLKDSRFKRVGRGEYAVEGSATTSGDRN